MSGEIKRAMVGYWVEGGEKFSVEKVTNSTEIRPRDVLTKSDVQRRIDVGWKVTATNR